ncbi:hypothetical protein ACMHYB_22185 [Sorangium sp. So ce1128]
MENDLGTVLSSEYAIERDDVEVHEAPKHRVEPLHEGHRAGLAAGRGALGRLLLLPARDLLDEDATRCGIRSNSQYDNDPRLKGMVDDFRIYNGALSPAEIAALAL